MKKNKIKKIFLNKSFPLTLHKQTNIIMKKEKKYVGLLVRDEIKSQRVTNGFVIQKLEKAGIKMPDSKFSNKLYGVRDKFNIEELAVINEALDVNFNL